MSTCAKEHPGAASDNLEDIAKMWGGGWGRFLFPGFWLVYLGQTISGVGKHSTGVGALAGYLIIAAFAFCYLAALGHGWNRSGRLFWSLYGVSVALTVAECFFAHGDALVFCVYLAVLTVGARTGQSLTIALVAALAVVTAVLPWLIPAWHGRIDWNDGGTIVLISVAMWGFFKIIESNIALSNARSEVARLAAENERTRIARDLHDLLGHSLTTITVKAGLARRLAERGDRERAAQEIAEVEELSRRTLVEVRAAVAGYRDVTLAGELASAREVLRAAGIQATLPGSVDIVSADAAEVLGWVVREGVTNVVRHSRAAHCTITLGPRWVEIVDDGRGGSAGAGNGLTGLQERLSAVGGSVHAGGCEQGWRLRAELPAVPDTAEPGAAQPGAAGPGGAPVSVDLAAAPARHA